MSEESARLRIPYLAASQAQKHVTHNEALTLLDTLVQASVIDKDLTTPPISPMEGDCYIVAATGTGAWTGWDNRVVRYIDGEWRSYLPGAGSGEGWLVYVQDEANLYVFDGSVWTLAAQPLDTDLTAIAGLAPSNDDVIQRKAGAWTNRTPAQLKTDLALVKGDVGLDNVDNTSDANKPVSTAQAAADDLRQPTVYCQVMATGNVDIATALNDGDVLNGVTLTNGAPVFLAFQTNPAENGVWGVFSTPYRWPAFPIYARYAGALISVVQGTLYAGSVWQCTSGVGGTLDATALNFRRLCRELLSANRTYYVRTDGSDSNDGLANTSGGAFLTVQKAIDAALALDLGGFDVAIQIADGTYTGTVRMETPQVGDGDITIQGNNGTPGNVILTATNPSNNEGTITARNKARLFVKDLEIRSTTGGSFGGCITADKGASIYYQNVNFGSCALQQVRVQDGGSVEATGNYAITGGGQAHWSIAGSGTIRVQNRTITITGTPTFSAFLIGAQVSTFLVGGNTYVGSANGQRFQAFGNSLIVGDASATALPGSTAGTIGTGGRYTNFNGPECAAAWGVATVSAGTPTLAASFNITSITDTDTGELTVTIATDFASANYAWLATVELPGTTYEEANVRRANIRNGTRAAGTIVLDCYDDTEDTHLLADPASWHFVGFGAQY